MTDHHEKPTSPIALHHALDRIWGTKSGWGRLATVNHNVVGKRFMLTAPLLAFVPLAGGLAPMRLGLVLAEGAEAVLTIRAFTDHCRRAVTPAALPGLHAHPA